MNLNTRIIAKNLQKINPELLTQWELEFTYNIAMKVIKALKTNTEVELSTKAFNKLHILANSKDKLGG